MSSTASSPRKLSSPTQSNEIRHKGPVSLDADEQIRRRAYELYQLRGSVDGYAMEDWLQAEAEIGAEREDLAA